MNVPPSSATGGTSRAAGEPGAARPCPASRHDPDATKADLVAGREKDLEFVAALIRVRLIDPDRLHTLVDTLTTPTPVVHATRERIRACVTRAARYRPPDPATS
jgi:hypothetical protein